MRIFLGFLIFILANQAIGQSAREADKIYFPKSYSKNSVRKWPLIVLTHGFKVSGGFQKQYFGLSQRKINQNEFILYVPGSTRDEEGHRFWNAMSFCCDHYKSEVDDVGHIISNIRKLMVTEMIDEKRISILGHSNGAFLAHRLICDHADLFAAAVGLAGTGKSNLNDCRPSSPVSLLAIHAFNDKTVPYAGMNDETLDARIERKGRLYPMINDREIAKYNGIEDVVRDWVKKNHCQEIETNLNPKHAISGKNCTNETEVRLWTIGNRGHVPRLMPWEQSEILNFLLSKRKGVLKDTL